MNQVAKKLEEYSWFPIIAWTLSIGFAGFVGYLTLQLLDTAKQIQDSTMTLDHRLQVVEDMFSDTPTNDGSTTAND